MKKKSSNNSIRGLNCAGMTLVEMMYALTIGVVILGISTGFLVEVTRATLKTQNNTQNDLTEWGIYAGVTIDTRSANGMTLYKTFAPASFVDSTYRITSNAKRGDFLVLTNSTQATNSTGTPAYQSITGYVYTAGATTGTGTFQKFNYQVPVAEQTNALETILTTHFSNFVLIKVAVGLDATNSDNDPITPKNRAFLYRSQTKRSGVLNLQISSGFSSTGTANTKLVETSFCIRS